MMPISREEAELLVTPEIAAGLLYCSTQAFNDWFSEVSDKGRSRCTGTTKANFINDQMIRYALDVFFGKSPDVKVVSVNGRYQLLIKGQLRFKMKKLNSKLLTSSIPTKTVIQYNNHQPQNIDSQLPLIGDISAYDITNLIMGYKENELKTKMQPYITCPDGRAKNHWVWPLEFTPLPQIGNLPTPEDKTPPRVIVPKKVDSTIDEQI